MALVTILLLVYMPKSLPTAQNYFYRAICDNKSNNNPFYYMKFIHSNHFLLFFFCSSFPNYVMIFRNPQSHAQAFSYPSIQYAQPGLVGPTQVPTAVAPQPHLAAPQSTLAATFINPTIGATAVLPSPEPTAIPAGTLLLQPAVDYSHQLHHHHAQQYPQYAHQLTYDILQSLQKPHPTSLLDSYVPSSVIWATAQRQRNSPFLNRQILHPIHGNFITPTIAHPAQQFYQQPHGSHQPGYNTIAYSTAQAYSKRSPKLVTERPLKLKKRN